MINYNNIIISNSTINNKKILLLITIKIILLLTKYWIYSMFKINIYIIPCKLLLLISR